MWHKLGAAILRFRVPLLVLLLASTAFMAWNARKAKLSYEFTRAIPTDNPEYQRYQAFRRQFGEDGNLMVVGLETPHFFEPAFQRDYAALLNSLSTIKGVENVVGLPGAITLQVDTLTGKLGAVTIKSTTDSLDPASFENAVRSLPFYNGFLYNPNTNAYLAGIRINKDVLNSKSRTVVVGAIQDRCEAFGKAHSIEMRYSGLPLIRTNLATKVQSEMKLFILLSFLLTAGILALFFRSWVAVVSSMLVVATGVVWSVGTIVLAGYQISILTGIVPSLMVVIGIPNCIYFLNKYHTEYARTGDQRAALVEMVGKMGIVTLFTNLTAAIGFGVFYFTRSTMLKEFGLVAGLNLLAIFVISLILLPVLFSFLPPPSHKHTGYLESGWMHRLLGHLATWTFNHRPVIYGVTLVCCALAAVGAFRLKSVTHIVDDLPKSDKVYKDLKWTEQHFKGIMPLEIVIDAKKKYAATAPRTLIKLDSLQAYVKTFPDIGRALAITEGIKFAVQAQMGGDSSSYAMPADATALSFVGTMLREENAKSPAERKGNEFASLLNTFVDSTGQKTRLSLAMADIGSVRLPLMLDSMKRFTATLFDTARYEVTYTGTSIVFLEGNKFIISSLRDSLLLAFAMILVCMVALFRSIRVVLIALCVNIAPLLMTAGIMGWVGVPLKPSTVLVFSVALGIAVDVTIRFLVAFRQERKSDPAAPVEELVRRTLYDTGLSIIYTSLVLTAGFAVFCLSQFDGTKSLGYLTSITLLLAMITNLTLQPAMLLWLLGRHKKWVAKDGAATV